MSDTQTKVLWGIRIWGVVIFAICIGGFIWSLFHAPPDHDEPYLVPTAAPMGLISPEPEDLRGEKCEDPANLISRVEVIPEIEIDALPVSEPVEAEFDNNTCE